MGVSVETDSLESIAVNRVRSGDETIQLSISTEIVGRFYQPERRTWWGGGAYTIRAVRDEIFALRVVRMAIVFTCNSGVCLLHRGVFQPGFTRNGGVCLTKSLVLSRMRLHLQEWGVSLYRLLRRLSENREIKMPTTPV